MLAKKATFFIHFMCNKLETDRPHRKKSTVHKKPLLIALSEMQSSQQAYTYQIRSGLGLGGRSSLFFWTGVSSVTQELFTFTTPVHLQFCQPTYSGYKSVICNQQTNPILCDIKATLRGMNPACFNAL